VPVFRRVGRSVLAGIAATAVAATLSITGTSAAVATPSIRGAGAKGAVKDSYIVVLKDSAVRASAVRASAAALTKRYGGTVTHTYQSALRGFSAHMTAAQARRVAAGADVKYVAQDQQWKKTDTIQYDTPSWGLDRLDQVFAPLDKRYTYPNTASNVHAYVIDTGVRADLPEFGGRVAYGPNFWDAAPYPHDCGNGHGTYVANSLGGTHYGVAKQVQMVAVGVLNCFGVGITSTVVAGIDWVSQNAIKPAVANLSAAPFEGGIDPVIEDALNASIDKGITYTVAAGNESVDACTQTPGRVPRAITVGATDEMDYRTAYTNVGSCVDLFAPGNNLPGPTAED
jgi:hypothetical protein